MVKGTITNILYRTLTRLYSVIYFITPWTQFMDGWGFVLSFYSWWSIESNPLTFTIQLKIHVPLIFREEVDASKVILVLCALSQINYWVMELRKCLLAEVKMEQFAFGPLTPLESEVNMHWRPHFMGMIKACHWCQFLGMLLWCFIKTNPFLLFYSYFFP